MKMLLSDREDTAYLAVFCLRAEAAAVEEALRAGGFARPSQVTDRVPLKRRRILSQRFKLE